MGFNRRVCRIVIDRAVLVAQSDDTLKKIFSTFIPIDWHRDFTPWHVILYHPDLPQVPEKLLSFLRVPEYTLEITKGANGLVTRVALAFTNIDGKTFRIAEDFKN